MKIFSSFRHIFRTAHFALAGMYPASHNGCSEVEWHRHGLWGRRVGQHGSVFFCISIIVEFFGVLRASQMTSDLYSFLDLRNWKIHFYIFLVFYFFSEKNEKHGKVHQFARPPLLEFHNCYVEKSTAARSSAPQQGRHNGAHATEYIHSVQPCPPRDRLPTTSQPHSVTALVFLIRRSAERFHQLLFFRRFHQYYCDPLWCHWQSPIARA